MTILVTGGAGYIGSHTCVALLQSGQPVVIFDNFCNSSPEVINRIERICGVAPRVVRGDVRDSHQIAEALSFYNCHAVIHFAGLKSVADSTKFTTNYYDNNVLGTLKLVEAMQLSNVRQLVFSSSATVYGAPAELPIREDHALRPFSPYGRTKMVVEEFLNDVCASSAPLKIAILRYFNPVGSHETGLLGEDPIGVPNNLMPFISQVAGGRRPFLNVFGNDYETPDGTGIRDYVHVMDLAAGHLSALEYLESHEYLKVNLGTGRGSSVLELISAYEKACGRSIPVRFAPRRAGDIASYYASPDLAQTLLGWRAKRNLDEMCVDAWRWQCKHTNG